MTDKDKGKKEILCIKEKRRRVNKKRDRLRNGIALHEGWRNSEGKLMLGESDAAEGRERSVILLHFSEQTLRKCYRNDDCFI